MSSVGVRADLDLPYFHFKLEKTLKSRTQPIIRSSNTAKSSNFLFGSLENDALRKKTTETGETKTENEIKTTYHFLCLFALISSINKNKVTQIAVSFLFYQTLI